MCELLNHNQNKFRTLIIETSHLLRKLSNISFETFHDFAVVFYQHVNRLAEGFQRLDVFFDHYFSNSLKSQTRMGRGAGATRVLHFNDDLPFAHNFLDSFLSSSVNKNECGNTLLKLCVTCEDRTILILTLLDTSKFDSKAEEADQKLVRHTLHSIREKYTVIEVQSIDTGVLVLLLAYIAMELESTNNIFNVFFKKVTPSPKWYDIVHVINRIGPDICKALPFFYCFTGCDTNSSFHGKGKCSFFKAWMKSEANMN